MAKNMNPPPNETRHAPFTPELLPVDEPLWGTFWQFDVLGPGTSLPGLELALLRAVRLDGGWLDDTSPEQFLADLHAAAGHPRAGAWAVSLAGTRLDVLAAPGSTAKFCTVVWFCCATGCLHAGYRIPPMAAHFAGMTVRRPPAFPLDAPPSAPADWLREAPPDTEKPASPAARLDAAILQWRLDR